MPQTRSTYPIGQLGALLEQAIKEQGLTYPQAADGFDCTSRHLRRVRNGEYPGAAAKYLRELGYDVELFAEVEPPR